MTPPVDARRALEQALSKSVLLVVGDRLRPLMTYANSYGQCDCNGCDRARDEAREIIAEAIMPLLSAAPREETPAAQWRDWTVDARRAREEAPADDDTETLKPCPFCGGEAKLAEVEEESNRGGYVVACIRCECSTRVWFPVKDSVDRILREAWNKRQPPPRPETGETPHARYKSYDECTYAPAACREFGCLRTDLSTDEPPASAASATEERSSRNIPTCFCGHAIISCGYDHETSRVYGKCDACGGMLLGPTRSDWLRHAPAPAERERR